MQDILQQIVRLGIAAHQIAGSFPGQARAQTVEAHQIRAGERVHQQAPAQRDRTSGVRLQMNHHHRSAFHLIADALEIRQIMHHILHSARTVPEANTWPRWLRITFTSPPGPYSASASAASASAVGEINPRVAPSGPASTTTVRKRPS
jgi:hypothetical protein